jgi:hypothetical protein
MRDPGDITSPIRLPGWTGTLNEADRERLRGRLGPSRASFITPYMFQGFAAYWCLTSKLRGGGDALAGGLVADNMGLGKTITMACVFYFVNEVRLCMRALLLSRSSPDPAQRAKHLPPSPDGEAGDLTAVCPSRGQLPFGVQCGCEPGSVTAQLHAVIPPGLLVAIVPPKLLGQWMTEIERCFVPWDKLRRLEVFTHHGSVPACSLDRKGATSRWGDARNAVRTDPVANPATSKMLLSAPLTFIQKGFAAAVRGLLTSVVIWDECHTCRGAAVISCFQDLLRRGHPNFEFADLPYFFPLSGTPWTKSVAEIIPIVELLMHDVRAWRSSQVLHHSTPKALRYLDYLQQEQLRDRELMSKTKGQLTKRERSALAELKRQQNQAVQGFMIRRVGSDTWLGTDKPLLDLPPLRVRTKFFRTDPAFLPSIEKQVIVAKQQAEAAYQLRLQTWLAHPASKRPMQKPTRRMGAEHWRGLRYTGSFPAYGDIVESTAHPDHCSLLVEHAREGGWWTYKIDSLDNSRACWPAAHSQLLRDSTPKWKFLIERIQLKVADNKVRAERGKLPKKIILTGWGAETIVTLRIVSSAMCLPLSCVS